ncbi:hypothetical protein G3480_02385 [Thiorhodococcus mannitoliphagus]|uniref:DUF72 domain-containing protein n=1 Tax=Thiorhodococcus mannitoliphagus TaxID=329406 RepID=A0A6P1DMM1_9GAMM|nr:hypothetical protein [Thiorhodococcus mannitoliphagus]NEX19169.1 hypothetical protein [Thiorhodococcus mannitoliphagus]
MSASLVIPLRRGWAPLPKESFYPEDLPSDWQLAYFANVLDAVLVPVELWRSASADVVARWREDVPDHFGFFIEDLTGAMTPALWSQLSGCLGDGLKGLVVCPDGLDAHCRWMASPFAAGHAVADAGVESGSGIAYLVPSHLQQDLRAARRWLEDLVASAGGRPTLLMLSDVEIEAVGQWQLLIDLLGLSRR